MHLISYPILCTWLFILYYAPDFYLILCTWFLSYLMHLISYLILCTWLVILSDAPEDKTFQLSLWPARWVVYMLIGPDTRYLRCTQARRYAPDKSTWRWFVLFCNPVFLESLYLYLCCKCICLYFCFHTFIFVFLASISSWAHKGGGLGVRVG